MYGAVVYIDCASSCPGYDTEQSDAEVPMILELWGMWCTPSLPTLPGPIWPGMVAPNQVLPHLSIKSNYLC